MFFSHNKSASTGLSTVEIISKSATEIIIFKRKKKQEHYVIYSGTAHDIRPHPGEVPDRQYQCERVVTLSSVLISHVHAPFDREQMLLKWHMMQERIQYPNQYEDLRSS